MEQFSKGLLKSFSNAFKKLYTNKGYKPEDLTKEPEFKKAIESTYEVLNFGIKDNVVDGTLLRKLQQDTFLFSAFKTHAELTEAASRLLLNADKKIRPWFDFKQEVLKLHQTYNVNYLEAEYEFAKQSSMMADKWQRADDNYWLQYRTAGDERVRESHAALHDTTLPKSDPFWSHYYPPNGWRCRCTTVSVRPDKYPMSDSTEAIKKGETATTQIGKDGKNKLEIFRFNPGKEQVVFPKNNAYSKVVGAGVVSGIAPELSKNSIPDFQSVKKFKGGGEILRHTLKLEKDGDYQRLVSIGNHFAKSGSKVELLPKYHDTLKNPEYKKVFGDLEGTKYWGKCPDLRIDGKYFEEEGYVGSGVDKYSNMLSRGAKQSERIIIQKTGETDKHLLKLIKFRQYDNKNIYKHGEVWLNDKVKLTLFYKTQ